MTAKGWLVTTALLQLVDAYGMLILTNVFCLQMDFKSRVSSKFIDIILLHD